MVDAVLQQEFGRGLSAENVHILDPFTGTGTFIYRLLTQNGTAGEPLIAEADLDRKFLDTRQPTMPGSSVGEPLNADDDSDRKSTDTHHPTVPGGSVQEIHANELVLLAYYLAALKIEEGYRARRGEYQPFGGIVLTDTFEHDPAVLPGTGSIGHNTARARSQHDLPIQVIVGNPPWSAGQKSSGDDNPRREYPHVEQRVRDTYGRRHREITGRGAGKSAGNLYVQAIRWASDRLNHPSSDTPGVVAFIHPNSLSNATSLAGMRAALRDEFTDVYVVNLLGDAMKSGDEFRREGDKLFGAGSRNGVQITVLVRNPNKDYDTPATLHYARVPEYSTLQQKFDWLASIGDVTSDKFTTVPVVDSHDWINLSDGTFDDLLPVCELGRKQHIEAAVQTHALGVATNCDTYVYSFSRDELVTRMRTLIDAYQDAYELHHRLGCSLAECTENNELSLADIKWTDTLKGSLRKGEEITFDESRIPRGAVPPVHQALAL